MFFLNILFYISLAIAFFLILFLVYVFKKRIMNLEQKNETMFDILNTMIKEINVLRHNIFYGTTREEPSSNRVGCVIGEDSCLYGENISKSNVENINFTLEHEDESEPALSNKNDDDETDDETDTDTDGEDGDNGDDDNDNDADLNISNTQIYTEELNLENAFIFDELPKSDLLLCRSPDFVDFTTSAKQTPQNAPNDESVTVDESQITITQPVQAEEINDTPIISFDELQQDNNDNNDNNLKSSQDVQCLDLDKEESKLESQLLPVIEETKEQNTDLTQEPEPEDNVEKFNTLEDTPPISASALVSTIIDEDNISVFSESLVVSVGKPYSKMNVNMLKSLVLAKCPESVLVGVDIAKLKKSELIKLLENAPPATQLLT